MNDPGRRALERRTSRKTDRRKPSPKHGTSARGRSSDLLVFGERQRREFEANPRPMRIFDRDTLRYLAVNDAAVELYGYTREEFLALTTKDTRHPDEHADPIASLDRPEGYLIHLAPRRRHLKKSGEVIIAEVITQDVLFNGRKARVSVTIDVTGRKQSEEELQRQKKLLTAIIDNLPVGIFIKDAATLRLLMANRASNVMVKYPKGGAIVPLFDERGKPWVVVGIAADITERKRVENALRESNEFLRSVIESSRDCIKVLDLDGRLLMMSAGGQRLLEIEDVTPLLNTSWLGFWHGAGHAAACAALDAARSGGVGSFEGYYPTVKGTPKWWDVMITPMLDAQGKPEKLLAVSRDITRRKRARDALRESEERFRQLAENIREVFWINTPAGDNLIYVSPAFEEIWGRTCESLYRAPHGWMEPIHPEDLPAVKAAQEKMPGGEHTDVEYRIIRPDGTLRWIRDRSYPMKRGDGAPLVCGIAEDITDQKRAEEERLTHAIHQRDALVREVHHRIKNHLQGIAGLLRNRASENPAVAETIEAAVAQLQSVAVVYGLQSELAESGVPLCRVLEAICSSAEGLSAARIERGFAADAGSIRLAETEAVPVAVALNELVFNAIEHGSRRGGTGSIEVALVERKNSADIRIVNRGRLPARFDYPRGRGTGTGLELVRTLLGPAGVKLEFGTRDGKVEVTLSLRQPLVAAHKPAATA